MAVIRPVLWRTIERKLKGFNGNKAPLIAGHKLLYRCNLECKMCPFWRRKDEQLLTVEEEVKMMESMKRAGVSFLGFEGGEPLLRNDVQDILAESHKRFHTSMVTNGWLLKNKLKSIEDYLDYMFVSIDGIGSLHDKMRGVSGSFDKAIEGVKAARGHISLSLSSTITEENYFQAKDLVLLAEKLGVGINFQIAYNYSTAEKESPGMDKLKEAVQTLALMKEKGYKIVNSKEYFQAVTNSWFNGNGWKCKPWLTMNVDPLGNLVMPCYVLNEYNGSSKVWDVDIVKVWNNYNWEEYESCNKCALSCYLEPSLFTWKNPSMIKERIIDGLMDYVRVEASTA
ncbi:MAG: PTO1314 family radical SAM protein [Candidatus Thermoplasmatota archaeon]|jgi:radical SAM family uncharacterized protein|nr:PTO1314 family radical SAM protein [Candidatus Thermoplasmatota archaeon]MCL5990177.1 PTO1314 family radical SAM protein [Candidatus Thermoplasmatota archaeon]